MKFFHFSQNNSGGEFDFNEDAGITHHVVIEAEDASDANQRAERIGLYFDGSGDCPCCGNRWDDQWTSDRGSDAPEVYNSPAAQYEGAGWMAEGKDIVVHYADGRREWFGVKARTA
jgi:hypothetical protein